MILLPAFEDPFYTYSLTLEGSTYVFEFRYNQRENRWFLTVSLIDGTVLIEGVCIVCNRDLLRRAADVRLPPGLLAAQPQGTDDSPPGLTDFGEGKRVRLVYFTLEEMQELANGG